MGGDIDKNFHTKRPTSMTVDRDEVVRCYRYLLGRDPENEAVVAEKMLAAVTLWDIIVDIIASPEFRQRMAVVPPPLRMDVPASEIEVDVSPSDLERLRSHVQESWEVLGRRHPHFSVLTQPSFLPESFAAHSAEFWATGDKQVSWLEQILKRHGIGSIDQKTCVDFGCGVGRLTAPLAAKFATVHGYDISLPHLDIAREHLADRSNVELHLVRALPPALVPTDVFFSLIVLQHNPPPIIALLIRSALQSLKPGGIAVFQLPTYHLGYTFDLSSYFAGRSFETPDLEMHCLPQKDVFRIVDETGCHVLEVREQDLTGRWGWDVSNVFVVQSGR